MPVCFSSAPAQPKPCPQADGVPSARLGLMGTPCRLLGGPGWGGLCTGKSFRVRKESGPGIGWPDFMGDCGTLAKWSPL